MLIALSTCGRSEAILELEGHQVDDGLIYFLAAERTQTSKRRSIVPVAPTLAPWLKDIEGRVIRYRAELAASKWRDPAVPEFLERDCGDIGKAFEGCLIDAGLSNRVLDARGRPVMLPPRRKLGEIDPRPKLRGLGTPNTLRHTIMTEMHRRGVPEAQIDAAAGHVGEGTNKRNYRHLRPGYLAELIAAVEDYWNEMRTFTTVHLRSQCGPKRNFGRDFLPGRLQKIARFQLVRAGGAGEDRTPDLCSAIAENRPNLTWNLSINFDQIKNKR
jgi:hypothetical protein